MLQFVAAGLLQHGVISMKGRTDCKAFVSGGRLNIGAAKGRGFEKLSVRNTVQCASTGHREIFHWDAVVELIQQVEEDLFKTVLHSKSQIHVTLGNLGVRPPWLAKLFLHPIREMARQADSPIRKNLHSLIAAERLEIAEVELEASVPCAHDPTDLA